jgi:endonuclease YncB( thermonuclease family)
MKGWLASLLLLAAAQLHAATFHGTVTHVTDGDTLWVRPAAGGAPVEIRLLDLDAPEGCQAFGAESARALRQRLLHQPVRVRTSGTDDYRRRLARVTHGRTDIGGWMVRQGHAWSTTFRGRKGPYARLQERAQAERRGLWAQPGALEPRRFRQRFGRCH